MQRISNSALLLPVAESALRPVNTPFALVSRLAARFLRSAAALFGKAPGLDSQVRRRQLLTPRARAVSGKAGFRSLSAIGIAASAALIVALAPSAFAVVATTDTITVQSATGSPASRELWASSFDRLDRTANRSSQLQRHAHRQRISIRNLVHLLCRLK